MIFVMKCGEYDVTSAMIGRCPWSIKNKSTDEDDVTGKLFPLFCPIDNFKYVHEIFLRFENLRESLEDVYKKINNIII